MDTQTKINERLEVEYKKLEDKLGSNVARTHVVLSVLALQNPGDNGPLLLISAAAAAVACCTSHQEPTEEQFVVMAREAYQDCVKSRERAKQIAEALLKEEVDEAAKANGSG